jgi:hypothetical protein
VLAQRGQHGVGVLCKARRRGQQAEVVERLHAGAV